MMSDPPLVVSSAESRLSNQSVYLVENQIHSAGGQPIYVLSPPLASGTSSASLAGAASGSVPILSGANTQPVILAREEAAGPTPALQKEVSVFLQSAADQEGSSSFTNVVGLNQTVDRRRGGEASFTSSSGRAVRHYSSDSDGEDYARENREAAHFIAGAKKKRKLGREAVGPLTDRSNRSPPDSSDVSRSSTDEEVKQKRTKNDSWPHPLAKLVGHQGCGNDFFKSSKEGRELLTQHRDFLRERTRNLKKACFPTNRVGWHNGLLAIQLSQIKDMLRSSVLSKTKSEAYEAILDLSIVDGIQAIDVERAKSWIKNSLKTYATIEKLVDECAKAVEHEANIARVVEKDGFQTVAAFEGSAEFEADFKQHLEYVRREVKKKGNGGKLASLTPRENRDKFVRSRTRGFDAKSPFNYGFGSSEFHKSGRYHTSLVRAKAKPSAERPCAWCKSPDHWVNQCPYKGK